ncbi:MAG: hypothetical protein O9272_04300 [Brevundimonas sp.]|nr:hypothetical protein [Brevundimonas sp.]
MRLPARVVIKQKSAKKLIKKFNSGKIDWSSKELADLKLKIRRILRKEQDEVCPYCQRIIVMERRNAYEDIEHFLDKSKAHYRRYAFSVVNIVLSCHACNFEKSIRDVGSQALIAGGDLRPENRVFRWPHPHFNDLRACIIKRPGQVYEPIQGSGLEAESRTMISDLKLDDPSNIEGRYSRLMEKANKINLICQKAIEIGGERNRLRVATLLRKQKRILDSLW